MGWREVWRGEGRTSRAWRRAALLGVVLGIGLIAIWAMSRPRPIPVVLATVQAGRVETTVANTRAGTVKPCRRSRVAPIIGGRIAKLNVHEGDRVRAGQVLLEIWNKDLASQVRVAQEQARAAALHAKEACALADVAESEAGRARQLRAQGFVTEERAERAASEAKAKRAACQAAGAEIKHSDAQIASAQAALERTILRAPFDGIVAEVTGELGEFTTPSPPGIPTPPAIDLIDDSCLYVDAPIDEVNAPAIRVGMPARISLDAFPGRRFAAHVRRIAPYVLDVEKQARTVDVEVEFNNPKDVQALLVGYSADAEIVLAEHDHVLRVPTQALLEGNRVLVYRSGDGVLEERRIKTGMSNWEYTEVLSGLASGDRVVVSLEREGVKPGAHVVPEAATGAQS
jgi:HlyD family secretion protein